MKSSLPSGRLLSVDVMRGMTLAAMIVVNMAISPELSWRQLLHSVWDGFTLADAIYPSFLFVIGNSLALVMAKQGQAPLPWSRILRRVILLVLCGIFVSNFPFGKIGEDGQWVWKALADLRIPGVLQRIGISYLIAALVLRLGGVRAAWIYVLAILPLSWWIASAFGDLSLAGSAVLAVDKAVFGLSHLYTGEGQPFDPEGLLGTFPATANLLAGYLSLRYLAGSDDRTQALRRLALIGLSVIGLALIWAQVLPLNKKLWSSSYALLNIGLDVVALAALGWLIDRKGWRSGTGFFAVLGKNPLALYILAEVLMGIAWTVQVGKTPLFMAIFNFAFAGETTGKVGSFLFGIAMIMLMWLIGRAMDRRGLYVRL